MKKAKILTLSVLAGFVITGCELPDKLPLPDLSGISKSNNKNCDAKMSDYQRATCISHKFANQITPEECRFLKKFVSYDDYATQNMASKANRCVDSEGVDIDLDKLMEKNK